LGTVYDLTQPVERQARSSEYLSQLISNTCALLTPDVLFVQDVISKVLFLFDILLLDCLILLLIYKNIYKPQPPLLIKLLKAIF
jgi:hypothetical protein